MSQIEFFDPIKSMSGKYAKDSKTIMRKKTYRAPTGKVLKEGVQESYEIVHPRDYTKNPPKGAELANINMFAEAKRISSSIINSAKYTDEELAAMTLAERTQILELRQQLEDFRKRFYAQFKQPDSEAPYEKKPQANPSKLQRKQYAKLDNFIQEILRERMKQHS